MFLKLVFQVNDKYKCLFYRSNHRKVVIMPTIVSFTRIFKQEEVLIHFKKKINYEDYLNANYYLTKIIKNVCITIFCPC